MDWYKACWIKANNMYKLIYVFLLLICFFSCNTDDTKDDVNKTKIANSISCEIEKVAPINFKNNNSDDKLYISILGNPCYEATLTIKILSDKNEVLYEYMQPFKKHIATQWDDPKLADDANNFVNLLIEKHSESASNLPPFSASEIDEKEPIGFEYTIKVNEKTYRNIVESNKPVFRHPTHYEEWRYIVYDEKSGQGIIILEVGN